MDFGGFLVLQLEETNGKTSQPATVQHDVDDVDDNGEQWNGHQTDK